MDDKRGGPPIPHGAPPTLLRSLAVTPSSSRQGSLCTNASIWYLALMNSDLMGLGRAVGRRVGEAGHPATSRIRVPGHAVPATTPPAQLTGLCLGGWLCAGRSALAQGPAGNAPRWSWPRCWRACAPSAGKGAKSECLLHTGYGGKHLHALATVSVAGNRTVGPAVSLPPSHHHPVGPPEHMGPVWHFRSHGKRAKAQRS